VDGGIVRGVLRRLFEPLRYAQTSGNASASAACHVPSRPTRAGRRLDVCEVTTKWGTRIERERRVGSEPGERRVGFDRRIRENFERALYDRHGERGRQALRELIDTVKVEAREREFRFYNEQGHQEAALLRAVGADARKCGSGGVLWPSPTRGRNRL